MKKKILILSSFPAIGTVIFINLLYFWIAPDVACKMAVYGFCLGVILLQSAASTVLWRCLGTQKAMPVIVPGSAFALSILTAGGIMLALNAPLRTALYCLIILCVLYLICAGYLFCLAVEELWDQEDNAVVTRSSSRHSTRNFFSALRAAFHRRSSGEETYTEHQVVQNRLSEPPAPTPEPSQPSSDPPPLPGRLT